MTKLNSLISAINRNTDRIASDKLINNIFWNSIARFGSAGISFLMTLFLMSVLNVADYGEFVFYFSVYSTIPFFLDFGMNNSLVSLGAKLRIEDQRGFQQLVATHLSVKVILLLVVTLAASAAVLSGMFGRLILLVVVLGACLGLWECFLAILKSKQEFKILARLVPSRNAFVFACILLLYYVFNADHWSGFLNVIMLVPVVFMIFIYLKYFTAFSLSINKGLLRKTFEVSKWIGLFTIITAVHAKADIYLLKYFADEGAISANEVGIFSAAFSLLALTNVLTSTFAEAILPKVSAESNHHYFAHFTARIRRTLPFVAIFALLLGIALYLAFTYGFYGKFTESVHSMIFIGIGMVLMFYIHTLSTLFYPLNRTDLIFKIMLLMFVTNIISGYFLIQLWGAVGAAVTSMLVAAIGLLCTYLALTKLLRDGYTRTA